MTATFIICFTWNSLVQAGDEPQFVTVEEEASITICWIERSLETVLKDIEKITRWSTRVDPNLIKSHSGSLISLDVRDVPVDHVLDEILVPRGLTHATEGEEVTVIEFTSEEEQAKQQAVLEAKWDVVEKPPQGKTKSGQHPKRDGWSYMGGKVYRLSASSSFNKYRVEHRWVSLRL
jgi:hypothetical protein